MGNYDLLLQAYSDGAPDGARNITPLRFRPEFLPIPFIGQSPCKAAKYSLGCTSLHPRTIEPS